ncbi:subtilisin-like protease protein [Apiospora sp. TS-2023a]
MVTPYISASYAHVKSQSLDSSMAEVAALLQTTARPILWVWNKPMLAGTFQQGVGLGDYRDTIMSRTHISLSQLVVSDVARGVYGNASLNIANHSPRPGNLPKYGSAAFPTLTAQVATGAFKVASFIIDIYYYPTLSLLRIMYAVIATELLEFQRVTGLYVKPGALVVGVGVGGPRVAGRHDHRGPSLRLRWRHQHYLIETSPRDGRATAPNLRVFEIWALLINIAKLKDPGNTRLPTKERGQGHSVRQNGVLVWASGDTGDSLPCMSEAGASGQAGGLRYLARAGGELRRWLNFKGGSVLC